MAKFSDRFRWAYHVFPLHAAKGIWRDGLLSKSALLANGFPMMRRSTTSAVDTILGFGDLVHFYLPAAQAVDMSPLPILQAQLAGSRPSPFPHAVLVIDTRALSDDDCTVCNFNIAVSKVAYFDEATQSEVSGGNYEQSPDDTLRHWEGFRRSDPDDRGRRMSEWNGAMKVPTLQSDQITFQANHVGHKAPSQKDKSGKRIPVPELLLRSPFLPTDACRG